ncbi:MAG: Fe-S cluster assembly protein SufD, partial [Flavobacteriales bacterium]|nr:Fe-S cluster assembly protein SufD [Flavobacteriales bacterium]
MDQGRSGYPNMSETMTTSVLTDIVSDSKKPAGFEKIRTDAETFLSETGIPNKRNEDWRYTNIKRLFDNGLSLSSIDEITYNKVEGVEVSWSDDEKLIGSTGIHTKEALAALNTSLFEKAFVIRVKRGTHVKEELVLNQIINLKDNEFSAARVLIMIEENASLKCQHHFTGAHASSSLLNNLTEIFVGQNAQLELNYLQELNDGSLITTTEVHCDQGAVFTANGFQLSGMLIRNNLNIRLNGEHAQANLNGFYMLNGKEHCDNHTFVDHLVPNCESNETYKGVLGGKSTGVFNGKVFVHPDAQKTNGYQQNKNILLTDEATMNSKPELEIYADDVKCSHGSTTGQLDEEAI